MHRLVFSVVVGLMLNVASAAPSDSMGPEEGIRETIDRMRTRIHEQRVYFESDPDRFYAAVESELVPHFDERYIGQIVLGRHWPQANETQRTRFIEAFKDQLVRSYAMALLRYEETTDFNWRATILTAEGEEAQVKMDIIPADRAPIHVIFYLRHTESQWKIYDVKAEGISMATNFRGQFNAVIKREGIEGLIARLEAHANKEQAEAEEAAEEAATPH